MMGAPPSSPPRQWPWQKPWVKRLLIVLVVLLLIAGGVEGYRRMQRESKRLLDAKMAQASLLVEFVNRPDWMDPDLLNAIIKEAQIFAEIETPRPPVPPSATPTKITNYQRLRDSFDNTVLHEMEMHFKTHRSERNNAWIERIIGIHRVYDPQKNIKNIRISAVFRKPVALIAQGESYYLVDENAVRLPGEYTQSDRLAMVGRLLPGSKGHVLMMIRGVETALPEVGEAFKSADAAAALKLVSELADQPYAGQISAINVSNFAGKLDKMAPQITLDTTYQTSIWWGRPPEEERFYEVPLAAKKKALSQVFYKYNRIDAGRDYVDIRFEQVRVPSPPTTQPLTRDLPIPPRRPT